MPEKISKDNKLLLILFISLLIIGAVIFTNILSFSNIENLIVEQLRENQMTKTEHAAIQMENHILQVKDELVTLSKFPQMASLDINSCSGSMRIIHEKIEGKIDSLLRVDRDGNIIECSSPRFSSYVGLNIKNKDYFMVPKETGEPFIAGMIRQGTSREIIISTPLFETTEYTPYPNFRGEFKGLLLSIVEVNMLYNLYLHPVIDKDKNEFLIVNIDTTETILKSDDISDYADIRDSLGSTDGRLNAIMDLADMGPTIVTSSELILGSETWQLIIFTPLKNVGSEIKTVQQRHLFSLGFVIIVIVSVFFFLLSLYRSKEELKIKLDKTNVTLEKMGITIDTEKNKYNQADIKLAPRNIYLVKDADENNAHELFISALNDGYAGLGIVRDDPREIRKKYNLNKTSFIWLSNTVVDGIPHETGLANILKLVTEFVRKSSKSVVLIDRLDYILMSNGFQDVVRSIYLLKDLAHSHDSIIILSVNPEVVDRKKLTSIEAETIDIYGRHLRNRVDLSGMELDILKYVNDRNVKNLLVSYRDITSRFRITKPTTRAKVSHLERQNLLNVEKKGRFKSLKITSAGRRLIS